MKLVLGMVVGLSPGEFVLDGDPADPQKWPQVTRGGLLWPNGRPSQLLLSTC